MESRRAFLGRCGAGAAAWTALGAGGWSTSRPTAAAFDPGRLGELGGVRDGAGQGGRRARMPTSGSIAIAARPSRSASRPTAPPASRSRSRSVSDTGSFGFGLRVLADGAWGFSASYEVTRDAIARAAAEAVEIAKANAPLRREPVRLAPTPSYRDTYRTKVVTDPFSVPIEQKLELLRAVAAEARKVAGVFSVIGIIDARLEDRFFASTEGSVIEQHVYQIAPEFTATAVQAGRKVKSRYYRPHCGLRRLRGRRAGRPVRPRAADRRGGRRAPRRPPRSRPASRTSSCCRPTWP